MKRIVKYLFIIGALLMSGMIYTSCSDMTKDFEAKVFQYPDITISDFTPKTGRPGQQVTITGTNFGEYSDAAKVYFNGVLVTKIVSYSDNQMVVKVPDDAGVGPIAVDVWSHMHEFTDNFNFVPGAKVSKIDPAEGVAGDKISIFGSNFGTDASIVTVHFTTDIEVQVDSIADDVIVVTVPDGGDNGPITLQIGPQEITTSDFTYLTAYGLNYAFNTDGDLEGFQNSWGESNQLSVSGGNLTVVGDGTGNNAYLMNTAVPITTSEYPYIAIRVPQMPDGAKLTLALYNDGTVGGTKGDYSFNYITDYNGVYVFDLSIPELATGATFPIYMYVKFDNVASGTSFNIDWLRSYKTLEDIKIDNPLPEGKHVFDFEDPNDSQWLPAQNATSVIKDGKLKVTFDPAQFEGTNKRRADLYYVIQNKFPYPNGDFKDSWVYTSTYPILAIKFTKPAVVNFRPDITGLDSGFSNNDYKKDFEGQDVYYWDLSEKTTKDMVEPAVFQFKIPDITSPETGYEVDWIRTFKSKEELQAFISSSNF